MPMQGHPVNTASAFLVPTPQCCSCSRITKFSLCFDQDVFHDFRIGTKGSHTIWLAARCQKHVYSLPGVQHRICFLPGSGSFNEQFQHTTRVHHRSWWPDTSPCAKSDNTSTPLLQFSSFSLTNKPQSRSRKTFCWFQTVFWTLAYKTSDPGHRHIHTSYQSAKWQCELQQVLPPGEVHNT